MTRALLHMLAIVLLVACGDVPSREHTDDHDHDHDRDHDHTVMSAGEIGSGSVYNLSGDWWDARGDSAPLARLAGRPQVVAMVYMRGSSPAW